MSRKSKKERLEKQRRRRRQRRGLDPWASLTPHNWRTKLLSAYDYSPTLTKYMERWLDDHHGEVGLDWARDATRLQHHNDRLKPGGGALYDERLSGGPPCAGVEWDAGMYHFNVSGDLLASKRHLGAAAALAPEASTVHYHLGLVYHMLGAVDRAEQCHRAALAAVTPGEEEFAARASYNLAASLLNTGHREEGLTHLRRALELMPDYPQARQALELLSDRSSKPAKTCRTRFRACAGLRLRAYPGSETPAQR